MNPARKQSPWRARLGALALGCLLLGLIEVVCVLLGWGQSAPALDPFAGMDPGESLFALNEETRRFEIRRSRLRFFVPDSFPAVKASNAFRIFCLGGSTVQGRPYARQTSFTSWLQLSLAAADPSRLWEVVNCGGVSYASYRLIPILEECLAYRPDLIILCTGHNEFLEERAYRHRKKIPAPVMALASQVRRLRTYRLMEKASSKVFNFPADPRNPPPQLLAEADALLDYRDGLDAYHRDEAWRSGVIDHFRFNVNRLAGMARQAGVPLMLILPPSNLKDSPPFKSEHRRGLTEAELAQWRRHAGEASEKFRTDLPGALAALERALSIDPQFAQTHYELAMCHLARLDLEQARRHFRAAREEDICPLRILEPMEQTLRELARQFALPWLDAQELLAKECEHGIPGDEILVDHVHPSIRGHQLIAEGLIELMAKEEMIEPLPAWRTERDRSYQAHLESLDPLYFTHGQRRLNALRDWTQGRADGPPIREKPIKITPETGP